MNLRVTFQAPTSVYHLRAIFIPLSRNSEGILKSIRMGSGHKFPQLIQVANETICFELHKVN